MPNRVQSDQGREFVNSLNDKLFKLTGVQHIISAAYHPQTNGLDERFNQTLQRALLKMVNENENQWDKFLDSVLFATLYTMSIILIDNKRNYNLVVDL